MVAGLKFLSKKGFNPQNMTNQKRVWEARQSKKHEEQKIRDRGEQLKRERDDEELSRARGEPVQLKFMYAPPPGMETAAGIHQTPPSPDDIVSDEVASSSKPAAVAVAAAIPSNNEAVAPDITQIQPGDDPAAAAFRRMLAAASAGDVDGTEYTDQQQSLSEDKFVYGAVLQGTSIEKERKGKEGLSALEKAVGRRDGDQSLSLDDQVARFPQLKNAPMAKGMNGTDVGVAFKPLGAQLRNVRCLSCGVWGHSRGERECEKSGWNPFAAKKPVAAIQPVQQDSQYSSQQQQQAPKPDDDERSVSSSSSSSTYRERKRRKKSSKRRHRKKESKHHRRSRSESPDDRERSRKKSKKSRRKEASRS